MASKKFFVDVDLYRNQLLKAVLENGTTANLETILTVAGQVGYDTELGRITYSGVTGVENILAGAETFADYITNTGADAKAASIKAIYDYYKSSGDTGGASVIGIEDTAGYYTADNIEGALLEIGQAFDAIGSSMEVVGNIDATNQTRNYPVAGDANIKSGATISMGDAFLVTGDSTVSSNDAANSHILMNGLWVGAGSLVVALKDNPGETTDADWFILDSRREFASETAAGIIALASQAEVNAGVDGNKAITSLTLKSFVENISGTTMYVETVASGLTTATVTHNLGSDVIVQVWLDGTEDITSGVALISGAGTAAYASNIALPGTLKFVCVGKTSEYWASL